MWPIYLHVWRQTKSGRTNCTCRPNACRSRKASSQPRYVSGVLLSPSGAYILMFCSSLVQAYPDAGPGTVRHSCIPTVCSVQLIQGVCMQCVPRYFAAYCKTKHALVGFGDTATECGTQSLRISAYLHSAEGSTDMGSNVVRLVVFQVEVHRYLLMWPTNLVLCIGRCIRTSFV